MKEETQVHSVINPLNESITKRGSLFKVAGSNRVRNPTRRIDPSNNDVSMIQAIEYCGFLNLVIMGERSIS